MWYFWNYIYGEYGNNAIDYNKRKELNWNLKLYVPVLEEISYKSNKEIALNISIWDQIVFECVEKWKLLSYKWLNKYYYINLPNTKIAIFDNHNVALYFIWKYFFETWKKLNLIHIDQHSDMKFNKIKQKINNLQELEKYVFEETNVGNYLIPAKQLWFIEEIYQIRTETALLNLKNINTNECILNIDLDFWDPKMSTDIKNISKIKSIIQQKVPLVLIATSPYFIEQKYALKLLNKILY